MADLDTTDDPIPVRSPSGMQALLEEYRRQYPVFQSAPVPSVEPRDPSPHPLMDALLAEYRRKGLL